MFIIIESIKTIFNITVLNIFQKIKTQFLKNYFNEIKNIKNRIIQKKMRTGFDTSINKKKTKANDEKTAETVTTSDANTDAIAVGRDEFGKKKLKDE